MADRIVPLNTVSAELSIEELEPRLEMQILGIGSIPAIRHCRVVRGPLGSGNTTFVRYCTTFSYTTITHTPGGGTISRHVV